MKELQMIVMTIGVLLWVPGCKEKAKPSSGDKASAPTREASAKKPHDEHDGHDHSGHNHEGHDHSGHSDDGHHGHGEEVELGTVAIGELSVKLAQGHGKVQASKEGHLTVQLPYNDKGATTVRAWLGTEDRTLSMVGKGIYTASKDAYEIHAMAPNPLPENVMWWIEVQKPDGQKAIGSAKPLL